MKYEKQIVSCVIKINSRINFDFLTIFALDKWYNDLV